MPIRLTGMSSGLDTEALVSELVSSYRKKSDKYFKAQTKLSWKQDAWKTMSSKIYNFRTKIDSLRFSKAYNMKTTSVSNSTKAMITAGNDAVNGTQSLNITSLAKSGYLTGGCLKSASGSAVTSGTTLDSLVYGSDGSGKMTSDGSISLNGKEITLKAGMSINDVVNKFKDAGVNASYDETNKRMFISAKDSGADKDFTLTALDSNGASALKALGIYTQSKTATDLTAKYAKYSGLDESGLAAALENYNTSKATIGQTGYAIANLEKAASYKKALDTVSGLDDTTKKLLQNTDKYVSNDGSQIYAKGKDKDGNDCYYLADDPDALEDGIVKSDKIAAVTDADVMTASDYLKNVGGMSDDDIKNNQSALVELKSFEAAVAAEDVDQAAENLGSYAADYTLTSLKAAIESGKYSAADGVDQILADKSTVNLAQTDAQKYLNENSVLQSYAQQYAAADADDTKTEPEKASLKADIAKQLKEYVTYAGTADTDYTSDAVRVDGEDATIYLNGAKFTSNSNTFNINGLTINALATTTTEDKIGTAEADASAVSITTSTDAQGIYDKIKDFLSEYNTLIKSMTAAFNAPSASEYEPLTDDEREALTDSQAEKWEQKGKDGVLRRDGTLDVLLSTLTTNMMQTINISGKNYSLATFGIKTLGVLNAEKYEQNNYHIDGDADDDNTSGNTDKLMTAINEDPESVMNFFQQLTGKVYDSLSQKMTSTEMRTYGTFYNDKEMAKEYSDYTTTISKWEEKVQSIEDTYYKKFSAMEKALSELQSKTSQLSGLLG